MCHTFDDVVVDVPSPSFAPVVQVDAPPGAPGAEPGGGGVSCVAEDDDGDEDDGDEDDGDDDDSDGSGVPTADDVVAGVDLPVEGVASGPVGLPVEGARLHVPAVIERHATAASKRKPTRDAPASPDSDMPPPETRRWPYGARAGATVCDGTANSRHPSGSRFSRARPGLSRPPDGSTLQG